MLNMNAPAAKKLDGLRNAAWDVLNADSSGLSIIEAMRIGQAAMRVANLVGNTLDPRRQAE